MPKPSDDDSAADGAVPQEPIRAEEPPPVLGTWRNAYTFVIVTQVVLLVLFYWITVTYR